MLRKTHVDWLASMLVCVHVCLLGLEHSRVKHIAVAQVAAAEWARMLQPLLCYVSLRKRCQMMFLLGMLGSMLGSVPQSLTFTIVFSSARAQAGVCGNNVPGH